MSAKFFSTILISFLFIPKVCFSQNNCESFIVKSHKTYDISSKCYYSGNVDCTFNRRKVYSFTNIRRTMFVYEDYLWRAGLVDTFSTIRVTGPMERGLACGKWIFYDANNTMLIECHYKKGKLDGILTLFDKNGDIYSKLFSKGRAKSNLKCDE